MLSKTITVLIAAVAAASINSACSDHTSLCCDSNGNMDSFGQTTGNITSFQGSTRRLHDASTSRNNHHNNQSQGSGAEGNQDTTSSGVRALGGGDHLHEVGNPVFTIVASPETALDNTKRDHDGVGSEEGEGDATMNMVPYPFDEWPRRVVAPPGGMLENARSVFTEISSDILVSHCCFIHQ